MDRLKEIYYDPNDPGSYGGVEWLLRRGKELGIKDLTRDKVQKFQADQQSYSLQWPVIPHFFWNPTFFPEINY